MRTVQKRNILEMIHTLHQAHDEIKRNMESKQYILAQDMLIQCQECAISIGTNRTLLALNEHVLC